MRRRPLRPGTPPQRSVPLPQRRRGIERGSAPKPRNAKRRALNHERSYGSPARIQFVQSLSCVACVLLHPLLAMTGHPLNAGRCDNAHTETAGAGMKAGYETIVPLCRPHHLDYDRRQHQMARPEIREEIKRAAAAVERLWRALAGRAPGET